MTAGKDFSAAVVGLPDLLLFDLLLSFSPLPAIAKSVFWSCFRCLLLIQNQNPPNDTSKTTTIGTTIAGMRVPKLLDEPSDEAEEDVAAEEEVFAAASEAEWADSEETIEAKAAELVIGTAPDVVVVMVRPSTTVSTAKAPVAVV